MRGHFSCKDGVINLGSHGEFMGDGMGIGGGTSGYSLYDSEDQSLVLQERAFIAGVFTIIPFAASTKDWVARWVQVDENNEPFSPIPLSRKEMERMARTRPRKYGGLLFTFLSQQRSTRKLRLGTSVIPI